jgi:(E)-4-hydroxy-3-methylbut-2-enyl-diphosphate synthase
VIHDYNVWRSQRHRPRTFPLIDAIDYSKGADQSTEINFVRVRLEDLNGGLVERLSADPTAVLIIETDNEHGYAEQRRIFVDLLNSRCDVPVLISRRYSDLPTETFQLYSATDVGGLLIDGLGDGIFLVTANCGGDKVINETSFNILQATRTRISKTEYISCPSCGRTLFDLQETTAKIRSRTNHLKGIKIGIMGCIVNGPGEMADADYGYVGSGPGRITLYRGKEVVKRNVPADLAVDALIGLIREDGAWIEPELVNT